jgi:hypothetical protein
LTVPSSRREKIILPALMPLFAGITLVIFLAVKTPPGLSLAMVKKEKKPLSIGPQFYTLLALTETIVAELRWGKKKNNRSARSAPALTAEPRLIRKRLSGKLKIERL